MTTLRFMGNGVGYVNLSEGVIGLHVLNTTELFPPSVVVVVQKHWETGEIIVYIVSHN